MLSLDRQNERREQYRALQPGWQPATEQFAAHVRRHLTPTARVLDVGCGRGGVVEQLDHPLARMVGVDPDWQSLREHRLPLPRAVAAGERLPLPSGRFALAYAAWVLEHLAQPQRDLAEIARILQPGGVFVFITPNRRHPLMGVSRVIGRTRRLQQALVRLAYGRAGDDTFPTYYRANSVPAVQALAAGVGLEVAALDAVADPTYLAFSDGLFRLLCRLERHIPPDAKLHLVGVLRKK